MPINRYQIRNVYSLADPELYTAADKDDPEALLEAVAMAGLVGVLRQLGDLAQFAAEIFHDLHEEVLATAARSHGLLVRVQQLELEIPPIERAFLSQTSYSAFFSNSGIDWHSNQQTTQNLITRGDLPRFVMDAYEECRGPPRLFLLDKFDVGEAGACLKRYTDPSIFKVEASSYETEIAETQKEKKIRQTKKKGSRWKGGEAPEVSQPSHAKLHQLFLEERVQTGATEAARGVKLKERPKKFPFNSESGESYMNKLLNSPSRAHEVAPIPSNGSRLDDSSIMGSALGSPMQNTSPCVSSRKLAESQLSYTDLEVDDSQIKVDNKIHPYGLQNGYSLKDIASETDNYMDALATMESEVETSITQGTYSDANKYQLRSQLSDSQSIENSTASHDGNNSITKAITVCGNSGTTSTSTENTSPVGADSPPQPFACIEIPFRPRVPSVVDNISVTQNPGHDFTNDTCVDVSKVLNVDQVASLEEGTSDSNEVCSNHNEELDSPRKDEEHQINQKDTAKCTSEQSDVLSIADSLSSFSFVRNLKGDLDNKYLSDSSIPMILPNILETTKNQFEYDEENNSKDSVISSLHNELSSDTTFNADIPVTEEASEGQLKDKGHGVLVISDQAETRVSYFSRRETESANSEFEPVSIADANTNECIDYSVLREITETESEERDIESTYSDVKRGDSKGLGDDTELERIEADSVNSDMETSGAVLLPVDVDKHEDNVHSVSEQDFKKTGEKEEVYELLVISPDDLDNNDVDSSSLNSKILQDENNSFLAETDQKQELVLPDLGSQPVNIRPFSSDVQLIDNAHEAAAFTESDNDLESKSSNRIDILEAAETSPLEDEVDQSNNQLHMQLPLETEDSQLCSLTQGDHETHIDTHLQDLFSSESVSVLVSEKPPVMEVPSHDINLFDQGRHQSSVFSGFGILPQLAPVKVEDSPPLPPLPPMQWVTRKLQSSLSTTSIQNSDNHFPPFFSSTSIQNPQVVGLSTIDETINLDTENQKSQHESQMLLPDSSLQTQDNGVKFAETLAPQAAVENRLPTTSHQEVFLPSSSPYPLPPVLDEMQNNIQPMKLQRPHSPLIDAVAAHDKTKLRKVSDRDTTQIPKGEEKDTLLDQIRAKSINLKPAVQIRPIVQGPTTNLRVAAILEKANAIRQAFAGSDDDEDDSDDWSDS